MLLASIVYVFLFKMNCGSCRISFSKKREVEISDIVYTTNADVEVFECDLCYINTCSGCITMIHDESGVPFLVCSDCVNNVDTFIANRFEDYLYLCKKNNEIPIDFSKWLKLPHQNDLRMVRKEFRRQLKEKDNGYLKLQEENKLLVKQSKRRVKEE
jgi:hypothetical protein